MDNHSSVVHHTFLWDSIFFWQKNIASDLPLSIVSIFQWHLPGSGSKPDHSESKLFLLQVWKDNIQYTSIYLVMLLWAIWEFGIAAKQKSFRPNEMRQWELIYEEEKKQMPLIWLKGNRKDKEIEEKEEVINGCLWVVELTFKIYTKQKEITRNWNKS